MNLQKSNKWTKYSGDKVFFTADEHYYHRNIIKFCNRPFFDVKEMHDALINNHNEVVRDDCITFHIGDFALCNKDFDAVISILDRLNGKHIMINGSHDKWFYSSKIRYNCGIAHDMIHKIEVDGQRIVLCHYAMNVWPSSFHGSWHLFGHSHGRLKGSGRSFDVGVDCNNFYPLSFEEITIEMSLLDTFNDVERG
jgi:calcineurin-like phosphoesterase family protein